LSRWQQNGFDNKRRGRTPWRSPPKYKEDGLKARMPKYISRRQQIDHVCHKNPTMHQCKGSSRRKYRHAGYAKPSAVKHSGPASPRPSFGHKPKHRLFVRAFQLSQTPERVCVARSQLRNRFRSFRVKVCRVGSRALQRTTASYLALMPLTAHCVRGDIQGTFREHSENIQETFREHSGNL
jgi:hypothetical protein